MTVIIYVLLVNRLDSYKRDSLAQKLRLFFLAMFRATFGILFVAFSHTLAHLFVYCDSSHLGNNVNTFSKLSSSLFYKKSCSSVILLLQ